MVYDFQYSANTNGIIVRALVIYIGTYYVKEESCNGWAYTINIQNTSKSTVKLLNRNWEIIDNRGLVTKVQGPGVVGENPILKPGEVFEYTSGTSMKAESGIMKGSYEFLNVDSNEVMEVEIPALSLDNMDEHKLPN